MGVDSRNIKDLRGDDGMSVTGNTECVHLLFMLVDSPLIKTNSVYRV